jgi:hypothetical protein
MHLPWLAQQYERTCADCGHAWRVPRYFARSRVPSLNVFFLGLGNSPRAGGGGGVDETELNREIQSSTEIHEQAESFRKCPECGSEHYSQRPVRS